MANLRLLYRSELARNEYFLLGSVPQVRSSTYRILGRRLNEYDPWVTYVHTLGIFRHFITIGSTMAQLYMAVFIDGSVRPASM